LSYAINRQEIVDFTLNGLGEATYAVYVYDKNHPGYDSSWEPFPYDSDKASQLLAEAGYSDPSEIHVNMILARQGATPNVEIMEAVGMMWEQLGITVEYETMDLTTFLGYTSKRELTGGVWSPTGIHYAEPAMYYNAAVHSSSRVGWSPDNAELDAMIEAAMVEIDDAKRAELNRQMGQMFYEEQLVIPVCYVSSAIATGPKIKSWDYDPIAYNLLSCLERIKIN
jgi:peptide/nickel transport system substrate-binding protein